MLTELCEELRNWFDREHYSGTFTIENGEIKSVEAGWLVNAPSLQKGQYFRVLGSVFNDGVHRYPDATMLSETFHGEIWAMAVPQAVLALAEDIKTWEEKYGGALSQSMSPFVSESFGGYSYSKGSTSGTAGITPTGWKAAFASQLNRWRKI